MYFWPNTYVLFYNSMFYQRFFPLSLISFMKWVFSTNVTIILVPKFQPIVSKYIGQILLIM